ncbi:hypothetical protein VE01_03603 [Pseudogymnoascus verrucosus]|uniref:Circumsporozoite protein n=1 Tax=Pseudogymnoascus verrucosus TaxID=342668 RepID=A0A1B8GS30_9PEZI|nr:uncharacterized protein VE01_03603 [Pseudogymnoascus verrucosus]OBT98625.1 hypothetical protein VE01_03603 [Pseudogymnoascus verrucosus]
MQSKAILLSLLIAYAEARFGQEQEPISAISAVTSGGGPGVAATLAGGAISTLLGAANPCAKLQAADEIIAKLGTGADAVAAAIGLVAAEQNFNPFATDIPSICGDPTLPATEVLRGVVPLVDPAVTNSATENANSAKSKTAPFNAKGLSVAQVMVNNGFTSLKAVDLSGATVDVKAGAAAGANAGTNTGANAGAGAAADAAVTTAAAAAAKTAVAAADCPPATVFVTVTMGAAAAADTAAANAGNNNANNNGNAATGNGGAQASAGGFDFGTCTPTMKFVGGLGNRPATEFTFQAIDPVVALGQQEALNPNIITNRICDQLTNVCNAGASGKAACLDAKAQILALGTRDASTAAKWNSLLGF